MTIPSKDAVYLESCRAFVCFEMYRLDMYRIWKNMALIVFHMQNLMAARALCSLVTSHGDIAPQPC